MKLQKETESGSAVHGKWYRDACGAAFAMELIGERWSIPVIRELMLGGRRFSDIRASLPGISAKTLTERLDSLEAIGILTRSKSPPPASVQLYELTPWGRELEDVMQALGRWSVRSPMHNSQLPLTNISLMLSMRTMIDEDAAGDLEMWVEFVTGEDHFAGRLRGGNLAIHPASAPLPAPDLRFSASTAGEYLPVFYGKVPFTDPAMTLKVEGDPALAQRFIDLFRLPPKLPAACPAAGEDG